MDRWKNSATKKLRQEESQKGEDKRWRRSDGEKVRREKMQVREKIRKSRNTMFFPSPFELSQSVGVSNFKMINLETLTLFWKQPSIELKAPNYFSRWQSLKEMLAPSHSLNVLFWPGGGLVGLL